MHTAQRSLWDLRDLHKSLAADFQLQIDSTDDGSAVELLTDKVREANAGASYFEELIQKGETEVPQRLVV